MFCKQVKEDDLTLQLACLLRAQIPGETEVSLELEA
jgi:hypothetical protein